MKGSLVSTPEAKTLNSFLEMRQQLFYAMEPFTQNESSAIALHVIALILAIFVPKHSTGSCNPS